MKRLLFIVFLLVSSALWTQEQSSFSDVYSNCYKGVAVIEEGVLINPESQKVRLLFKRVGTLLEKKMLDEYYTFSRGSCFLVSQTDKLFISNYHVISYLELEEKRKILLWRFVNDLAHNLPPGYISKKEIENIVLEFKKLLVKNDCRLLVKFYDESYSIPQIVESEQELDIALLKASLPDNIDSLPLGDSSSLSSGQEVAAIGFPIQNTMSSFLKEFKATFTTGTISALRDEKWGIQHTASINPGNSGGPLLNKNGMVVGINVGTVRKANDLFYAIPIEKCIEVLKQKGYSFGHTDNSVSLGKKNED